MALVDLVEGKVKDESGKLRLLEDFLPAVEAALATYSAHRPKLTVVDLPGNASNDLPLPASWEPDYSALRSVEYPVAEVPASLLEQSDWELYQSPTGLQLRLPGLAPAVSESVRITFTVQRQEADVPRQDQHAVACLAAAICCDVLANIYTQTGDSTIGADVVNHRSKGDDFARRAKQYRQRYYEQLGVKEGDSAPAASVSIDTDRNYPGGGDRLTHQRRFR